MMGFKTSLDNEISSDKESIPHTMEENIRGIIMSFKDDVNS